MCYSHLQLALPLVVWECPILLSVLLLSKTHGGYVLQSRDGRAAVCHLLLVLRCMKCMSAHASLHACSPELIVQDKGWAQGVGDVRLEVCIVAYCTIIRSK